MRQPETEKRLTGKVFLLTGASRGIGAATAIELARQGATVIGPHRNPKMKARATEVVRQVEAIGGRMIAPVADVTRPEDRAGLIAQIKQDFGKIDGIIFNHAGGMEKKLMEEDPQYHLRVNGWSKQDLLDEAVDAGVLQAKAVVIDVPSLWSTFQRTGIAQLPAYDPVAEGKKLGEILLKARTRAYNHSYLDDGREIKFGSVCGHAIGDTITVRLLGRMDREAMAKVETTAEGGKLPTIVDMANAIATMAQGNFEQEDIVFVGPPQITKEQMPEALPMYDDNTRYVGSLVIFDANRAFGYYRVSEKDTLPYPPFEDPAVMFNQRLSGIRGPIEFKIPVLPGDTILAESGIGVAFLKVGKNYTKGHFTDGFGISILPGHKIIAVAAEVASLNPDRISDVSVKIGNTEVARVSGLEFEPRDPESPEGMTFDRLIEVAAQTLGLAFLHSRDIREVLPLFAGVKGPVEYLEDVLPGQKLEMEAILADGEGVKQFSGDVTFRVDDEVVARVLGIDCRLSPTKGINRVIGLARRRLG